MKEHWHLHAMVVHAVVGLAPLAAVAAAAGRGDPAWEAVARLGLAVVAAAAAAGTVTGVAERDRQFANWLPTHRAKLVLSLLLLAAAGGGAAAWPRLGAAARAAAAVATAALALALSHLGIRITLGRHRLLPPRARPAGGDALERVRARLDESARIVDPTQEVRG